MAKDNTRDEGRVRSADGTSIAFSRAGHGPALILVEPAGHYRGFSALSGLATQLSEQFTVYQYDRRGRGASGDAEGYAPEREVEDIAALIAEAGGSAFLYGFSSGALLVLHAAAAGHRVPRLAMLEPPIGDEETTGTSTFTAELAELVAAGRDADAVEHFNTSVGVPVEMIAEMKSTPAWSAMEAVAPTLVYDSMISDASSPALPAAVTTPALVIDSGGSSDDLTGWAATVAGSLPNGTHRTLPGQWHGVPDEDLAPVLAEFFNSGPAGTPPR